MSGHAFVALRRKAVRRGTLYSERDAQVVVVVGHQESDIIR